MYAGACFRLEFETKSKNAGKHIFIKKNVLHMHIKFPEFGYTGFQKLK
jgi:hypothetical protein